MRGLSLVAASGGHSSSRCAGRGPLIITASPVAEHRLQTHWLSNCGSRAQLLRGMWDLPRPGFEPVSPALAGRLSTTAPPGKPWIMLSFRSLPVLTFKYPRIFLYFHTQVFFSLYPRVKNSTCGKAKWHQSR